MRSRTPAAIAHCPFALLVIGLLAMATSLTTGCSRPLQVNTTGQIEAFGDMRGELAPTPTLDPVTATTLPHRRHSINAPNIAVVDVDGLLLNTDATGLGSFGENPVSVFRERLDAIEHDRCVCAVVIRINSPGGSVTATDIMWRDLLAFKQRTHLPVVACLMDVAAGGGYYLATAADSVIAHPTSVTGAIGCILNVYNLQDLMSQFNIVGVPIKAGKHIDLGSPIKALDDDKRKMLQAMADEYQDRFRDIVLKYRPEVDAADGTTFDGRVFTAEQARRRRLIDEIGYLDDAVAIARTLACCSHANMVFYHRPNDPALSPYAITPNVPLQKGLLPFSIPGLDRSKMPSFLYLWQIEPTVEATLGK